MEEAILKNLRVLLVEDDRDCRDVFAILLRLWGAEVITANDGAEALEHFNRHGADLLISDIGMPRMNGLELSKAIRELDRSIPIILASGADDRTHLLGAVECGVNSYVFKPVEHGRLYEVVEAASSCVRHRRQLEEANRQLQFLYRKAADDLILARQLMERMMRAELQPDDRLQYFRLPTEHFAGDIVLTATPQDRDELYLFLGDATGHGLSAAIQLPPLAKVFYTMVHKGLPVSTIVREMNATQRFQSSPDRFVAAVVARLDHGKRTLEVWNGGCPPGLFVTGDGIAHQFHSGNLPLGIVDGDEFADATEIIDWKKPGTMLFYSDGLIEATDNEGKPFGVDGLLSAVLGAGLHGERLHDLVVAAWTRHLGLQRPADDVTLASVRCGV